MQEQGVAPEQIEAAINDYLVKHPIEGITEDDVKEILSLYVTKTEYESNNNQISSSFRHVAQSFNDRYTKEESDEKFATNEYVNYNLSAINDSINWIQYTAIPNRYTKEESDNKYESKEDADQIKENLLGLVSSVELNGNTLILKNEQGTQLGTVTLPQNGSDWTEQQIKSLIEGYGYALSSDIPTESDINSLIDAKLTPLENLSSQLVSMTEDTLGVM